MRSVFKSVFGIVLMSASVVCAAPLTNPGFETGDWTGWTLSHPSASTVVTSWTGDGNAGPPPSDSILYGPKEGRYFAVLAAGGGVEVFTLASQPFTLGLGESIAGFAAFDYRDTYDPASGLYNDTARVRILDQTGNPIATPWLRQGADAEVTDYWDGPWETWSFTAPQAGIYQVEYSVANFGDNEGANDSRALFDMATTVPDGGSTGLMFSAALGLLALARRHS